MLDHINVSSPGAAAHTMFAETVGLSQEVEATTMHHPHPAKGQEMGNHGGKSTAKRDHKGKKDEVPVDAPNYIYNSLPEAWSDGVLKHDVSLEGQPQHHEILFDHQPHIDLHIVGGHHLPFHGVNHRVGH